MFVDLVGSTALSARLDPEEMREVLRAYQNTVTGEIARFEGTSPSSWATACSPTSAGRGRTRTRPSAPCGPAWRSPRPSAGSPPRPGSRSRRGSASRPASWSWATSSARAPPGRRRWSARRPNLAARLQEAAAPGAVVVADGTRRLLGEVFELRALGPTGSRASPGPWAASGCSASVPPAAASRPSSGPAAAHGRARPGAGARARALAAGRGRRGPGGAAGRRGRDRQVAAGPGRARRGRGRGARRAALPVLALSHRHRALAGGPAARPRRRPRARRRRRGEARQARGAAAPGGGGRRRGGAAARGAARDRRGDRYPAPDLTPQQQRARTLAVAGRAAARARAPPAGADGARGRALESTPPPSSWSGSRSTGSRARGC